MSIYKVEITEYLQRIINVEANSEDETIKKVKKEYDLCNIVLDDSNIVGNKIEIYGSKWFHV